MSLRWWTVVLSVLVVCGFAYAQDGEGDQLDAQRNLIPNSGFEQPAAANNVPEGWGFWQNPRFDRKGTVVLDKDVAHEGERSARFDNPEGKSVTSLFTPRVIVVEPGATYTLSAWIKGKDGVKGSSLHLMWGFFDEKNGRVKDGGGRKAFDFGNEWQRVSASFEAPEEARGVKIYPRLMNEGTVWIDAIQLEKGDEPTEYVPGPEAKARKK